MWEHSSPSGLFQTGSLSADEVCHHLQRNLCISHLFPQTLDTSTSYACWQCSWGCQRGDTSRALRCFCTTCLHSVESHKVWVVLSVLQLIYLNIFKTLNQSWTKIYSFYRNMWSSLWSQTPPTPPGCCWFCTFWAKSPAGSTKPNLIVGLVVSGTSSWDRVTMDMSDLRWWCHHFLNPTQKLHRRNQFHFVWNKLFVFVSDSNKLVTKVQ